MTVNIDPELIYRKLIQAGEEWSDKHEAAELLEKAKDSVLSEYTLKVYATQPSISSTKAKEEAQASQGYRDYIESMVKARGAANKAKVRYESAKSWFEALRTKAATMRQEMKTMPHHK